ncbi:MAG: DoxX family protein [Alphaproteobacteria bacterium]|jgi:sorbitol-specific phosphotransferase system component IIC|nr:DoxX family protein [Alphaproteobacteria bacterium]
MEQPHGKAMTWTGRILAVLVGLFMAFDSIIKVVGMDVVTESFVRLGYDGGVSRAIGLIEVAATLLYLWPRTAMLGAVLLTGIYGGAIASHLRIGDPLFSHTLFGVYLGVAMWAGLWLRDARLRALFPIYLPKAAA